MINYNNNDNNNNNKTSIIYTVQLSIRMFSCQDNLNYINNNLKQKFSLKNRKQFSNISFKVS